VTSGWQQGPGLQGGPPGWGPVGWAPPYGQGYVPPPEPAGPRPRAVVAGTAGWAVALVCSLIGDLWSLTHLDEQLAEARRRSAFDSPGLDGSGFVHDVALGAAVFALVWVAVHAMFLVFAWQGRNWARIVLWVLGGLGMFGAAGLVGAPPGRAALLVVQLALTLAGIVLLALPRANDWYRRRGAELAARRR
jgi:hypothetical protein